MTRPAIYTDATRVCVNATKARGKLQPGSDRRAIINRIVTEGGCATIASLSRHFDFDVRGRVIALVRIGWLEVTHDGEGGPIIDWSKEHG